MLSLSCAATSPLIKKGELPKEVRYYSDNQKFKITPDWYWRFRPSLRSINEKNVTVGYDFIENKSEKGLVIGEININNEVIFVVEWAKYGYFFVRESDRKFAIQFEKEQMTNLTLYNMKRRSPIPEEMESLNLYSYTQNPLYQEIIKWGYIPFDSLLTGYNNYIEYANGKTVQLHSASGYMNKFLVIPGSEKFKQFCSNQDVDQYRFIFPSVFLKDDMFTNDYGQVFQGQIFAAQYIICRWGEAWYVFPCKK
jgi:hypothetical protein